MASQISKRFVVSTCSPLFIRQVALYDSVSARATLCSTWSLVARNLQVLRLQVEVRGVKVEVAGC